MIEHLGARAQEPASRHVSANGLDFCHAGGRSAVHDGDADVCRDSLVIGIPGHDPLGPNDLWRFSCTWTRFRMRFLSLTQKGCRVWRWMFSSQRLQGVGGRLFRGGSGLHLRSFVIMTKSRSSSNQSLKSLRWTSDGKPRGKRLANPRKPNSNLATWSDPRIATSVPVIVDINPVLRGVCIWDYFIVLLRPYWLISYCSVQSLPHGDEAILAPPGADGNAAGTS